MSKVEYFIGGGGDKSALMGAGPTEIMKFVRNYRQRTSVGIQCEYRGYEDRQQILEEIKKNWKSKAFKSIRLTGHSWGGQAALDLTQDLFLSNIPVDELITLDPVSLWPFGKVVAGKWVNVYQKQSFWDSTIGAVPILGNALSALITLPSALHDSSDYIANVGGQLGSENGAYNIEVEFPHSGAQKMYERARAEMINAPTNPKAIGAI
ncbi:hypothetical protein BTA51_03730 [Hahella sp. CCB-MM4]|uniref:hypothetical protein n=1 Tax=Hahella sp. (strain CCB-MM4) TaxID=1926491 RepID=UPI000B9C718A|nr:hypothetical protein [Hahella sp. CCB-MM4]OZG74144.1 hypothetical protein BTA51_03730 [Hahella sp. CCB-MM4]